VYSLHPYKLAEGVYWVGVKDWNRRLFDSIIPLPKGTSYNTYLVIGSNNIALIDTVNPGFEKELEKKIRGVIDPGDIDYIVMNHAEPDHAGAIPYILDIAPKAKLVTTSMGLKMAKIFYGVPTERIHVVRDGDIISLGSKTLRFIEAPMLHWPETMFTFLEEDGILFSCDFFGSHIAEGMFDDEVEDILIHAQRYWAEIMMPFRSSALRALEKISKLDIKTIAPSHGPIYRNPNRIIEKYLDWSHGKTKKKILIAYASMWGYTYKIVKLIENKILSQDIDIVVHDIASADVGDIAKDLVDSSAAIIATPTVLGFAHPLIIQIAYLLKVLKPPIKYGGVIVTYAWGSNADQQLIDMLRDTRIELIDVIKVNVTLTDNDIIKIKEFIDKLTKKIRYSD